MNSLTHKWNLDVSLSRKPAKEGKRKKSRKPIRAKRSKPRKRKTVIRLTGEKLEALRAECWVRDDYRCVVCGKWLPLEGDLYTRMHMAHLKSRGAGGSDTLDNVVTKCYHDHIEVEHGLKWGRA